VDFWKLLGARIRICIEAGGYRTVEEFAYATGLSKSTLSDILSGKKGPTVQTLIRIASALKITLSTLFEDAPLNIWVRELPPDYFVNRSKIPRSPKPRNRKPGGKPNQAL
jgi:transcriptional regulator with XRE-family HTH domain